MATGDKIRIINEKEGILKSGDTMTGGLGILKDIPGDIWNKSNIASSNGFIGDHGGYNVSIINNSYRSNDGSTWKYLGRNGNTSTMSYFEVTSRGFRVSTNLNGETTRPTVIAEVVNDGTPTKAHHLTRKDYVDNRASGLGLSGETWVDETDNREFDTTYTNDTGKPILISINIIGYGDNRLGVYFYINDVRQSDILSENANSNSDRRTLTFIIPIDSTYELENYKSSEISLWFELK